MNLLRTLGLVKDERSTQPKKCYLCSASRPALYLEVREFAYYRCGACGGVFTHPRLEQSAYLETET